MDETTLYNTVRGVWRASIQKAKTVDYVFEVYHSLIVAVYKPTHWYICKEAKDKPPSHSITLTERTENRIFFVDEGYERNEPMDMAENFYYGKSISGLKVNQSAQNPITYLNPENKDSLICLKDL